jgi:hypothetical protein
LCPRERTEREIWVNKKRDLLGFNRTAVAVANKNARIILALMKTGEEYKPSDFLGAAA